MYALMDLCMIRPENLKEVCSSEQFVSMTRMEYANEFLPSAVMLVEYICHSMGLGRSYSPFSKLSFSIISHYLITMSV